MSDQKALAKIGSVGRQAVPGVLSTLMSLTSDAVLVFDGDGRIIGGNPQAEALTGLALHELIGTSAGDLLFDANRVHGEDASTIPLPTDGSRVELSLRLASGGATIVGARCDRVSAPGETYLLVMRSQDRSVEARREHDRLVDELSLANRRLSGTLRIVLETIDAQNLDILFNEVLEQISDTLDASGVLIFLSEADGFRLRGRTRSLSGRTVPQFMAYGEGLETMVTKAGVALRLRLMPPSEESLRSGALQTRELLDEDAGVRRRIPARQVPPFSSLICVPVWFGGHVIAIIEVGWAEARAVRRDDARLLDSVAQYLSVELAAAIYAMHAVRSQRLDAAAARLHDHIDAHPEQILDGDLSEAARALCEEMDVRLVPINVGAHQGGCMVDLPECGITEFPFAIDKLVCGFQDADIAVVPMTRGSELAAWLARSGCPSTGVLLDRRRAQGGPRAAVARQGASGRRRARPPQARGARRTPYGRGGRATDEGHAHLPGTPERHEKRAPARRWHHGPRPLFLGHQDRSGGR